MVVVFKIFIVSMLVSIGLDPLFSQAINIPTFKKQISKPDESVQKDWSILGSAEGDLNKDGLDDLVIVLRSTGEESNPSSPRVLLIYFRDASNTFTLKETNSTFILKIEDGGIMGNPFQNISINRGSILIDHSGGSRERWSYTHRFNYRDNGFYLIGSTENITDTATNESTTKDYNLLTGKMIETSIKGKKSKVINHNPGKNPLVLLKDAKVM